MIRSATIMFFAAAVIAGGHSSFGTSDPPAALDVTKQAIDAMRAVAQPIDGEAQLDPLMQRIGDARGVLLGESSHGTSEFYTMRAVISKRLVQEMGFSFIAVEGDWGACARVNRYVKHLPGAPASGREALLSFDRWPRWMWANEETLELVEWLREYNADRDPDQRIGFYGLDIYGFAESIEKGPGYLREIDTDAATRIERAFKCFAPHADNPQSYVRAVATGMMTSCAGALREAAEHLRERADTLRERDAAAYLHAKQNVMVVKHAERHFRAMASPDAGSWNARAEHFHQTFLRLLGHYGEDSRGIVWAHNTHIGDARATPMAGRNMVNIGSLARQSLGETNVVLIGFGTHRGRLLAGPRWEGPRMTMTLPAAIPGSFEELLYRLDGDRLLLVMNDLMDEPSFDRAWPHRAVGVTYDAANERGNYVPSHLPRRYDAFIFIEETRELSPLHERE